MKNIIIIANGSAAQVRADRYEVYAKKNDLYVIDTLIGEKNLVEKVLFYMERESIDAVLVHSIHDISTNNEDLKKVLLAGMEHGVSINAEELNWGQASIVWDGGAGC